MDGSLTIKIAEAGAMVHGINSSQNMIAAALRRGLSAEVCNGESLSCQIDAIQKKWLGCRLRSFALPGIEKICKT